MTDRECRDAVSVLAEHVPEGSRLVLVGRADPPLRLAWLRGAGVTLGPDELVALHERTEGWPAGLYLAALYLREGGLLLTPGVSFGGDDRLVREYLESELPGPSDLLAPPGSATTRTMAPTTARPARQPR